MKSLVLAVGMFGALGSGAGLAHAFAPAPPAAPPPAVVDDAEPARGAGVVPLPSGQPGVDDAPSPALADPDAAPEPDLVPLDSLPSAGSPKPADAPAEPPAVPEPQAAPDEDEATPAARNKTPVVSDGPVAVTTRLSPEPANIGDVLTYEIIAAYPRDVRVNLPTRVSFEPLHHVDTEEGEPESTGDGLRKTFRVQLQHFAVGEAEIPGFPLTYVDADGGINTVQVPARPFEIESLLVNEDDPQRRGEDPPISRTYPDTLTEVIIISAVLTLLVALIAWLILRRIWGRKKGEVLPPPIPAHEVALGALDELEGGELLAHGEVQRYYVELTEIAFGYIEGRFGVKALDRTTEEIRESLRKDPGRVAPLDPDEVMAFLEECDLVKFARLQPPEAEAREALGTVRGMVEGSIPTANEPQPAAPAEDASESEAAESEAAPADEPAASADEDEPAPSDPAESAMKAAAEPTEDAAAMKPAAGSEPAEDAAATKLAAVSESTEDTAATTSAAAEAPSSEQDEKPAASEDTP